MHLHLTYISRRGRSMYEIDSPKTAHRHSRRSPARELRIEVGLYRILSTLSAQVSEGGRGWSRWWFLRQRSRTWEYRVGDAVVRDTACTGDGGERCG